MEAEILFALINPAWASALAYIATTAFVAGLVIAVLRAALALRANPEFIKARQSFAAWNRESFGIAALKSRVTQAQTLLERARRWAQIVLYAYASAFLLVIGVAVIALPLVTPPHLGYWLLAWVGGVAICRLGRYAREYAAALRQTV